jgi:hypothetical protein
LGFDGVDGEVHVREPPRGRIRFLAVDGDVARVAAVGGDELLALDEHATGAAARIVDAAFVRFDHFHQDADDGAGCVELAAELAFGLSEFAEEVFVDAPQGVAGLAVSAVEADRLSRGCRRSRGRLLWRFR